MPQYPIQLTHGVEAFVHMKNLSEVSLRINPWLSLEKFVPLLKALARVLSGKTLEKFALSVPLVEMKHVLPFFTRKSSFSLFPRRAGIIIKELQLTFRLLEYEDLIDVRFKAEALRYLLPFLIEHSQALESMSLIFRCEGYFAELFRLLLMVPNLHLSKLAIHGSWAGGWQYSQQTDIVTKFINSQRSSLTHFTFRPTTSGGLSRLLSMGETIDLPNLREFDLDARIAFLDDFQVGPTKMHFALPFRHNITSLKLDTTLYQPEELHDLIQKIHEVVPDLKQLSIAALYLIPQTIDVIQCSLRALEVLRFKIATYGPCWPIGSSGINGVETRSHSEARSFPIDKVYWEWKLKELGVFKVCPTCAEIYPVENLVDVLVKCIPSIESVDRSNLCKCFPHL